MSSDCAFLFLTERCNLACRHCYVSASPASSVIMSRNVFTGVIGLLEQAGICDVRLTGGEPTTHPELEDWIHYLLKRGFSVGLTSNGLWLTEQEREPQWVPRLSRCWLSLYGPTPADHDALGGRRAQFDLVLAWAARQSSQGVPVGISVLLTPKSVSRVQEIIERCRQLNVRRLRFIPLQPDGRGENLVPAGREWRACLKQVIATLSNTSFGDDFDQLSINDPFSFGDYHGHTSCLLNDRRMWSVTADGRIFGCCFTVTEPERTVTLIDQDDALTVLSNRATSEVAGACRALNGNFWPNLTSEAVSCPIGGLDLLHHKPV